jgi:L-cystine transport system substrate-binding protein
VSTSKVDATIATPAIIWDKAKRANLNIKTVGDKFYQGANAYYVFKKDDSLKSAIAKIDKVIQAFKADGTLSRLSIEFLGADYK